MANFLVSSYGAHADGVTNDADHIQAAIDAAVGAGAGNTVVFQTATYLITAPIVLTGVTSLTLSGATATIKTGNNYTGYSTDGVYGLDVTGCTGITFSGLTFDGNKAGTAAQFCLIVTRINTNITFTSCTFKNSNYHALYIQGANTGITFTSCAFTDNCSDGGPATTDSDVYGGVGSTLTFTSCAFTRTRASKHQAMYISGGTGTYTNNTFTGPAIAYDFRAGTHTINGGSGTVGTVIILQQGAPQVTARDLTFNIDIDDLCAPTVEAAYATGSGTLTLLDCMFTATTAATWRGLRAQNAGVVIARRCRFLKFSVQVVYVENSAGGHIIDRCLLDGSKVSDGTRGTGTGVYSDNNTGSLLLLGCEITNVTQSINNVDGLVQNIGYSWPSKKMSLRRNALLIGGGREFAIGDTSPDVWLSAGSIQGPSGGRFFTEANDEYFVALDNPILPGTSDFWLSFWVWRNSVVPMEGPFRLYSATIPENDLGLVFLSNSTQIRFTLSNNLASVDFTLADISAASWIHYALSVDRSGDATLYRNATSVQALDVSAAVSASIGTNVHYMGIGTGFGSGVLDGRLSRFGYGTGLLTQDDVTELYNTGSGKFYSELGAGLAAKVSHYWNLNETSGDAYDALGLIKMTDTNTVTSCNGPTDAGIEDGGSIPEIVSLDGNDYSFAQAVGATQPTYDQFGPNNKPAMVFDGSQYFRHAAKLLTTAAGHVFVVAMQSSAAQDAFLSQSDEAKTDELLAFGVSASGQVEYRQSKTTETEDRLVGNAFIRASVWHLFEYISSGTAVTLKMDNVTQTITVATGANAGDWGSDATGGAVDSTILGGVLGSSAANLLTGSIAEVLVYNTEPTDLEVIRIRNNLAKKYALKIDK
jgi:hypothetical protein